MRDIPVRKRDLHEPEDDSYIQSLTPGQHMAMVWEITKTAWAMKGEPIREPGRPRHLWPVRKLGLHEAPVASFALVLGPSLNR